MGKKIIAILVLTFSVISISAWASPENDRVYQLESLGWLKSSDNIDDIFSEFLDQEFTHYFDSQSRFVVKKLTSMKDIFEKSKLPYTTLIQNNEVLKKIAQKFRVESLIRTRVYKEAETYRFVLEWIYAPRGDVLASHEFRFVDPGKESGLRGSELPQAIQNALDQLIAKLPFIAQVTGVEGEMITVNLGRNQNIQKRQILTIYTLQSLKRHPKLNTIEEWRWQAVGRAQIEQVEDSLSFAKVMDTEPGQNVIRYQKVREILPAPPEPVKTVEAKIENDVPRIGWLAGNIAIGSYSRQASDGTGTNGRGGSGFSDGLAIEGLVWLNSRWLAEFSLSGTLFKYNPTDLTSSVAIGNTYGGNSSQLRLAAGYALLPVKTIFDTAAWVHFGYRSTAYTLGSLNTDITGPSSFGSVFLGIGGEMPYRNLITFQLGIDIGLLRSAKNTFPDFGASTSSSDLMFEFGGFYHLTDRLNARLMFKIDAQSMDFSSGASVSQKILSVAPSILYYF